MPTFVDMFAGAGGFSEGFLQAEENGKVFEFLLASDINPTCEVTHRMRYNHQLGLNTEFLTKDITTADFIEDLSAKINKTFGETDIDVLTGGPPCQSFSLAGERRKNDKKDDLFSYYLKVIETFRPKYFVMENVAGILTKDNGKIKDRILREIRNIVDYKALSEFLSICQEDDTFKRFLDKEKIQELELSLKILQIWIAQNSLLNQRREDYLKTVEAVENLHFSNTQKDFVMHALLESKNEITNPVLEEFCTELSNQFVDAYRNNKNISEDERNIIRQALLLISHQNDITHIREKVKHQINASQLKRSTYKKQFDQVTDYLNMTEIVKIAVEQCDRLIKVSTSERAIKVVSDVKLAFEMIFEGAYSTMQRVLGILRNVEGYNIEKLDQIADRVALYRINNPISLRASDYGVPQNRIRVVFIGCRNDQELISEIPATVNDEEKVCVAEAIGDLNYIGIGDHSFDYDSTFFKKFRKSKFGSIKRSVFGVPEARANGQECHTYAEWSRKGRLNIERFPKLRMTMPNYTAANSYKEMERLTVRSAVLHNHETSNHNDEVQARYGLIRKYGDYHKAKEMEPDNPLLQTSKRNYSCLSANKPSSTIVTIGDDFAHYASNRSLTVREMARLQSFDDSFVFQGKRTTGGDRRKLETPQYTQVGNAVPPLMAHAIASEILKRIK